MKKTFLIILLLTGGIIVYNQFPNWLGKNTPVKTTQETKQIQVQQKVVGQSEFSIHQISEGKTALDLLKQTGSVVTTGEKENTYVVGINGIKADEEKKEFWSFYVNDKIAPLGAGSYKLKNGDKIEWKIENY